MEIQDHEVEAVRAGFDFDFKPGDAFNGAIPEAEKRGYPRGTLAHKLFVIGYIQAVTARFPRGVPLNENGAIAAD